MAVLAVMAVLVAGCSPMPTLAVRLSDSGAPHLIDNTCDVGWETARVEIRGDNGDAVLDEKDPVFWSIELGQPTRSREFVVGQTPEGAEQKVAWEPPAGGQELEFVVYDPEQNSRAVDFTLDQLKDGKVSYQFKTFTAEQFAEERVSC